MAIGDIIADVDEVTNGGVLDFQPAAGVEIIITGIFHEGSASADQLLFQIIDGTINDARMYSNTAVQIPQLMPKEFKIGITNTIYLRRFNVDAQVRAMGYTGIQIK